MTAPGTSRVLCFGDSNTYGIVPGERARYAAGVRWPGVLQQLLGAGHDVVEEGLPGRTTDVEDTILGRPGRAGLGYFTACVDSQLPLDVIVLMLGTNDLRTRYARTPDDVARALGRYLDHPAGSAAALGLPVPRFVVVAPPPMDGTAERFVASMPAPGVYDAASAAASRRLAGPLRALAAAGGHAFLDVAPITRTGIDGCHLDADSHRRLAGALAPVVRDLAAGQASPSPVVDPPTGS